MKVWNPLAAMDRRIEGLYGGRDHWIQQKAHIGAWICLMSLPLMVAVPLVGLVEGTEGAGFLLAANIPMLVLGMLGLWLILRGHFLRIQDELFLGFGLVHVATGSAWDGMSPPSTSSGTSGCTRTRSSSSPACWPAAGPCLRSRPSRSCPSS